MRSLVRNIHPVHKHVNANYAECIARIKSGEFVIECYEQYNIPTIISRIENNHMAIAKRRFVSRPTHDD